MSVHNKVAYRGHVINPQSSTHFDDYRDGALVLSESGTIVDVGHWADIESKYSGEVKSVVNLGERLILPGLIDMHLHLPQVTQIGKSGQTLLGWLEKYIFPAESRFSDTAHATKIAKWFFDELARNGTTLSVVFTTVHRAATDAAFEVAAQTGSRVIMGKVMMDRNSPEALSEDAEQTLRESLELCEKWHGHDNNRLLYAFTPRFAVTSTEKLLTGTAESWRSKPGTYMHTHLAESEEECAFVQKQFSGRRSYTDVYDHFGLVGDNTIFAHSIHLDDEDLRLLSQKNASLAHCPSSNFFLKSGVFPYSRANAAGVRFGLGSDVAAGPQMCIFQAMKDANYAQPNFWLDTNELLYRATLGGAVALNLDKIVGNFAPGKEADFIVVDPRKKSGIASNILRQSTEEILSTLVFMGDDRLIDATYVRGRCLFSAELKQKSNHLPRGH